MDDDLKMVEFSYIPNSWIVIDIETVIREGRIGLVRSAKEQFLDRGHPYIRMQHYDLEGKWNFNDVTKVSATSEELKLYKLKEGDVLFNTRNSYELVGKVAIWGLKNSEYLYNNNLLRLRFFNDVLPKWIAYQMISPLFRKQIELVKSATTNICAIYGKDLNRQAIVLSPLNEQRRLVAKIEALKTRSQRVKDALSSIPALLEQFRQSVLAAAFRGDLTADWRQLNPDVEPADVLLEKIRVERRRKWEEAELAKMKASGKAPKDDKWKEKYKEPEQIDDSELPELPRSWCWTSFAQVSDRVTVGHVGSMKDEYIEEGIPFLRSQNVRENKFDPEGLTFISRAFHKKIIKSSLESGDLVVVRSGNVGVACVIPKILQEANCSDLVIVKQPRAILPDYGAFYMNSVAKSHVNSKQVGVALTHFNTKSMAEMQIPVPPLDEQKSIITDVKKLFKIIENIVQQYQQSKDTISQLEQSILAEAFRGALVPQDPNDEPASVLLERIRAEREKSVDAKTKRTKKSQPVEESIQMKLELE